MKIFITGVGGYIGGSVAAALVAAGHLVRGLTRSEASARRLSLHRIEPVIGTLDDEGLLCREAQQADGVINAASADHRHAVISLLSGLEGSNKPLLHTSGSSIVGDDVRGDRKGELVFDEAAPWVVHPAKQARRDIDLHVLQASARGVRSVVICPSLIYGLGRGLNPNSVQVPFLVANAHEQGVVQMVGKGQNVWSNVHIDDVVDLYLLALTSARAGAFYFAENGEASLGDIATAIAQRLRLPGPQSLQPEEAARRWGEPKAYFSLGSNSRVRANAARRQLNWSPRHASVIDWILGDMPIEQSPRPAV